MHKTGSQLDASAESQVKRLAWNHRHSHEADSASSLLAEYYRCPEDLLVPFLQPLGHRQHIRGTFGWGRIPSVMGGCRAGNLPNDPVGNLEDALDHVRMEAQGFSFRSMPVRWLRICVASATLPTSARRGEFSTSSCGRRTTFIRPLLGVPVRRHIQKMHLRGWDGHQLSRLARGYHRGAHSPEAAGPVAQSARFGKDSIHLVLAGGIFELCHH